MPEEDEVARECREHIEAHGGDYKTPLTELVRRQFPNGVPTGGHPGPDERAYIDSCSVGRD